MTQITSIPEGSFPAQFHGGDALSEYINTFRHPDLPKPTLEGPLDLFASDPSASGYSAPRTWKHDWPNWNKPGVYLIYSVTFELLYVGMSQYLHDRLNGYFGDGPRCVIRDHWGERPRYVITIGVSQDTSFEIPALELFLIRRLKPKLNARWY